MSWVHQAFGIWYPIVYPHRDEAEAGRLVAALDGAVAWDGRRVADVGCGSGRHLVHLARHGARAIGVDLSPTLLAEARVARADAGGHWSLVRGDMRALPFADASFDVVTSFFTSFGYFGEAEDRRALAEAARALRPGGRHVLDTLNREAVLAHPTPVGERTQGGFVIREQRRIEGEGRRVVKVVEILGADRAEPPLARYEERVALYRPEQVRDFLRAAGLVPEIEWGDYAAAAFDPPGSPRHVLISRKEGA